MARALPFTAPNLLAPMEGVTEPCFRDLVLARNPPTALGGAFTEFARRAAEVGAPLVDLNFGCPAKGALRTCAGSALLREPRKVEELVRACADALPDRPVTAKIRAGYEDDRLLEDLARAAEAGGASMLTVHCRTRAEGYQEAVDWSRLARAAASVSIPVCGNGGVRVHADLERLRRETGCRYSMVGRAALGDPWIFSGTEVSAAEAARFLLEYAEALAASAGVRPHGAAGRVKQLLQFWTAGALLGGERHEWLREADPARLFVRLRARDRAAV